MKRLIDADALTNKYGDWYTEEGTEEGFIGCLKQLIDEQPTIDAVPVVHCKDCKWYGRVDKRRFYRGMDCLQNRIGTIIPDKDYCSRAERKEE